jgi:diaminopropionate ammonia-lyase
MVEGRCAMQERPTHIFVQAGWAAPAAAVCGYFWERDGGDRPFMWWWSRQGRLPGAKRQGGPLTAVTGDIDTLMAGWPAARFRTWPGNPGKGTDAFCVISDSAAVQAMRLLAHPLEADPVIVAGESAVAGVAAALAASQSDTARALLGLNAGSRILFFGSEAATDPVLYAELVGETAQAVAERADKVVV